MICSTFAGIGLMIAKGLAQNGAKKVYILGRRFDVLQAAAKLYPNTFVPVQCDITSKSDLQFTVDQITTETGYINILVANSGIYGTYASYNATDSVAALRKRMFTDVEMDDFTRTFHVNVTGAYFTMLAFLELLDEGNKRAVSEGTYGKPLKQGGRFPNIQSQVIMTTSVGSFIRGSATAPAYGGSKAAIMQMAKHAASNLAPYGIRVNSIAPGCKSNGCFSFFLFFFFRVSSFRKNCPHCPLILIPEGFSSIHIV